MGNQLPGIYLVYPDVIAAYKQRYPDVDVSPEAMEKNRQKDDNFAHVVYNNHIVYPMFH